MKASQKSPRKQVSAERFLLLMQLWLHLNPGQTQRDLTKRLRKALAKQGVRTTDRYIEEVPRGQRSLVYKKILDQLLEFLKQDHGLASEIEAMAEFERLKEEIEHSVEDRKFSNVHRLQQLAVLWKVLHHQPSSGHLAELLRQRLAAKGMAYHAETIRRAIEGKIGYTRSYVVTVMEEFLLEDIPDRQELEKKLKKTLANQQLCDDLSWVQAKPIAELANRWIREHPGSHLRCLTVQMVSTIRRMGYAFAEHTTRVILNGGYKRTRGFVYRAMLKQFNPGRQARIPREHIIKPAWQIESAPKSVQGKAPAQKRITLNRYLRGMSSKYALDRSSQFLGFVAFRAEKLYGIPRAKAEARILKLAAKLAPYTDDLDSDELDAYNDHDLDTGCE